MENQIEKYKILKKTFLSDAIINNIASYFLTFEQVIKNGLDHLLLFIKPPFDQYELYFGVRWITPLSICYKYNREKMIPKLMHRYELYYTKYDLYALAQLKRWQEFQKVFENNDMIRFCYRLVFQYAREADAEAFIVWLKTNFKVEHFIKGACYANRTDHQVEHQLEGVRNVYSRLVGM